MTVSVVTADLHTGQLDAGPPAVMTCPDVACIHRKRQGQQYMCPQKVTTGSAGTSMQIAHVKVEGLLLLPPPLSEVVCGDDCVDEDDIVSFQKNTKIGYE